MVDAARLSVRRGSRVRSTPTRLAASTSAARPARASRSRTGRRARRPFVAKLAPGGNALAWSTLLGGSGDQDAVSGLAADAQHRVWVAGRTSATDLPVSPNADTSLAGYQDAFAMRLRADGTAIDFGSYVGGAGPYGLPEYGHGVAAAPGGRAWLVGETDAADFPVTDGASRRSRGGLTDGFATLVDPAGSSGPRRAPPAVAPPCRRAPAPAPAAPAPPIARCHACARRWRGAGGRCDSRSP